MTGIGPLARPPEIDVGANDDDPVMATATASDTITSTIGRPDGRGPDGSDPPSEHRLPGIARYAIVALPFGDPAPDDGSAFIDRWRRAAVRLSLQAVPRGHSMGDVRVCPACEHDHAVGTTCLECPGCRWEQEDGDDTHG